MPNRHSSSESYRYGFQGQEMDDEIKGEGNSLNYTFRMHDPRIGRFFAVDPLFNEYPWYTPYQFSGNNVVMSVELEGLEEKVIISEGTSNQYSDGRSPTSEVKEKEYTWEEYNRDVLKIDPNNLPVNGAHGPKGKGVLVISSYTYKTDGVVDDEMSVETYTPNANDIIETKAKIDFANSPKRMDYQIAVDSKSFPFFKRSLESLYVTDEFDKQRPGYKHKGVDIAFSHGGDIMGEPIYAPEDGQVVQNVTYNDVKNGGARVRLKLADGTYVMVCHLVVGSSAHLGKEVKKGDLIGNVGNTGVSSGPHLHLELWLDSGGINRVNPNQKWPSLDTLQRR